MRIVNMLLCCLPLLAAPAAAEMYKWTDAEGRVHFSDRKPDTSRPVQAMDKPMPQTVGGPATRAASPPPAAASPSAAETPPAAASAPAAPAGNDMVERQRKMADLLRDEREAREAEAKRIAEEKAEKAKRCAVLRDHARTASAGRLYTLNDKGERVYMNDAEHAAHQRKLNDAMNEACR